MLHNKPQPVLIIFLQEFLNNSINTPEHSQYIKYLQPKYFICINSQLLCAINTIIIPILCQRKLSTSKSTAYVGSPVSKQWGPGFLSAGQTAEPYSEPLCYVGLYLPLPAYPTCLSCLQLNSVYSEFQICSILTYPIRYHFQ